MNTVLRVFLVLIYAFSTASFSAQPQASASPIQADGHLFRPLASGNAPVAQDDLAYTTPEDTPLSVDTPGVLGNDSDEESDGLTAVLGSDVTSGNLSLSDDGSFIYIPAENVTGQVSFTYFADDGTGLSAAATVIITIIAQNDAPTADDEGYNLNEDTTLDVPAQTGVLANDQDVDNDPLTAQLVAGPSYGTLDLQPDGSFSFTPDANFYGTDSFTYQASDGSAVSNEAVVTLTIAPVNDLPVAVDNNYSIAEDGQLIIAAPGVLGNDTDADPDTLYAMVIDGTDHGSLTLNANGSFIYTPVPDFSGTDTFQYYVNDGTSDSLNPATVTISVDARNDAPQAAANSYTIDEDTPLSVAAPGILTNDGDIDGDTLIADPGTSPAHGVLALSSNGAFTYTPNENYNGADTFTYYANDGQARSNAATVTININPVNDPPVARDDTTFFTDEDTPLSVNAPGVLSNDSDVENNTLSVVPGAGPGHGTLTLRQDGSFLYTPAANYTGTDSFTYFASDGQSQSTQTATVTIRVDPVNDVPTPSNDGPYRTDEDTTLTVTPPGVLANDTDPDGNPLSTTVVTGVQHGTLQLSSNGAFTYTPTANYNGPDSFTYRATDPSGAFADATVTIDVSPLNDAPVGVDDSYPAFDEDTPLVVTITNGVLSNDNDIDSTGLTAVLHTQPLHGTLALNANGAFTYTPVSNYNGADSFRYRAFDGSAYSAETLVSLTIRPVNDTPVATARTATTDEDTAVAILLAGTDIETPASLAFLVVDAPLHGTLTGTAPNLTYTPAANYNGDDSFTFRVRDSENALSTPATVSITINAVNDAPVGVNDTAYTIAEDGTLTVATPGVLANDTDVENNSLRAVINTLPAHGTLTLGTTGSFTYTPLANYNGPDSFTYFANDGQVNAASPATVSITVTPVNDVPVAVVDGPYTTAEDIAFSVTSNGLLTNDTDIDNDPLTASIVSAPLHGTVNLQPNGLFTYTPQSNYNGPDTFSYRASDGVAQSNTIIINITITPVDDAPSLNPSLPGKYFSVSVDGVLQVVAVRNDGQDPEITSDYVNGLLKDIEDVEDDGFTAVLVDPPANGTLTVQPDGSFTYSAPHTYLTDTFTFRACQSVPPPPMTRVCSEKISVVIDVIGAEDEMSLNWLAPVTNTRRWRMGTENITLKVKLNNCTGCGVRYYRWNAPTQQYVELATVLGSDTSYTFSSTILNAGWGLDGWNQILANAIEPGGGLASARQYIWLVRLPYENAAVRRYIPLGAGK